MSISYAKLWLLLESKKMKKKDLQKIAGISSTSVTKLAKNETVRTDIIDRICVALNCDVDDIMEITNGGENNAMGKNTQ